MRAVGEVIQVIGSVIDVQFKEMQAPRLYNAVHLRMKESNYIVAEVVQQMGGGVVRCIAMSSTDGLTRGAEVIDTGTPITVPVGEEVLGRMFNVLGEPIDFKDSSTYFAVV